MTQRGVMSRTTQNAIIKCLHPDQRNNATEADRDAACRGFNAGRTVRTRHHVPSDSPPDDGTIHNISSSWKKTALRARKRLC